jgi:hypothetical protein
VGARRVRRAGAVREGGAGRVVAHIFFLCFPYTPPLSPSTPTSTHHPSSLTLALWPMATKVRTSFPALLWMPRPSSRGGTPPFATAPPRSPLMISAFVSGWVYSSCRSRCRPRRAHVVLCPASRFFGSPCCATPLPSASVAETPACARPQACDISGAIAQLCTPARTRTTLGRPRPSLWLRYLAPGTSPTCLSRRRGLRHAGC